MRREKNHRKARLGIETTCDYDSIKEYRKRRAERLAERGVKLNEYRKSKDAVKLAKKKRIKGLTHLDDEGEEEQQNNKKSGSGGGHGNTRLPFGLCERFGIPIGEGWTPKDAWAALAGKGITADGAYARLKRGEDPGTPADGGDEGAEIKEPEPPKEPVTTVKMEHYGGAEYKSLEGRYISWAGRGMDKWRLYGDYVEGTGTEGVRRPDRMSKHFHTKTDMLVWLRDQGVEEFSDPETGEILSLQEMELPKELFRIGSAGYTAVTIGLRDGKYTMVGTDLEGKKKTINTYESLKSAMSTLTERLGVKESDVKLSPALKKREEERLSWLKSDKKEYVEIDGEKYGDLRATIDRYSDVTLTMSTEDGEVEEMRFGGKTKLMKYLKEQGVENVRIENGTIVEDINPQEYEVPETIATIYGTDIHRLYFKGDATGEIKFCGEDIDGREIRYAHLSKYESFEEFKDKLLQGYATDVPIDESLISIDEKSQKAIDKRIKEDEEKAKRRAEFESKSVRFGDYRYADMEIVKGVYGQYRIEGYNEHGNRTNVTGMMSLGEVVRTAKEKGVDPDTLIKDESLKAEYEEYKVRLKEFEAKAVTFDGYKYVDMEIKRSEYDDGRYYISGYDEDGEQGRVTSTRSMGQIIKRAKENGIDPDTIIKDESIREEYEKYKKRAEEFEAKAIEYDGQKYSDVHVFKDTDGTYQIRGYDEDGDMCSLSSWYSDMYSICEKVNSSTGGKVDPETLIKDDEIKKEYHEYKKSIADFEAKAVQIGAEKFAGVSITSSGDDYILYGYDARGRKREIFKGDYRNVENVAKKAGKSASDFPMDEKTQKLRAFQIKEQEAIASGEYSEYDGHAYKDIRITKSESGSFRIRATDVEGETKSLTVSGDEDETIDALERRGITKYEIVDHEGKKLRDRPTNGMRKVRMLRKQDGTFEIFATTEKGQVGTVHSSDTEAEARKWLRDNGVDDSGIKTKGMNPNDDVPRTHTCLSLAKFDEHRMDREDQLPTLAHMSDKTKREVVDMMTEVFDKGTYRMRMRHHFGDVLDGHFKNLLETGTSGGSTSKEGRRITGEKTFGHPHNIKPIEAEKYGYCAVGDDQKAYESGIASWYGDILYTFKKDAINDRVTYSAGDTLDSGRPLAGYAGDKPTYEGVSALSADRLRKVLSDYRSYKAGAISFEHFHEKFCGACRNGYIECHYHGMLTIDDVESIIIPVEKIREAFRGMTQEKKKQSYEKLQSKGIKLQVYEYGEYKDGYEFLREAYHL